MDSPVVLTLNRDSARGIASLYRTVLINVSYACRWLGAGPSLRIIFLDKNNFPYAVYSGLNTLRATNFYRPMCCDVKWTLAGRAGLQSDRPRCYMPRCTGAICIPATIKIRSETLVERIVNAANFERNGRGLLVMRLWRDYVIATLAIDAGIVFCFVRSSKVAASRISVLSFSN
jgi:hypothetical protein